MKIAPHVRWVGILCCTIALIFFATFAWYWSKLNDSLPPLDGEFFVTGLNAEATLSRDELGTAIIDASNRTDAMRALGFAHAQDRFLQMDLMRRRGAGELSALLGEIALGADRFAIVHRFRERAREVIENEPAARRALVDAYTEGVNAGLGSLGVRPWEYVILGAEPRPWLPEDSALVFYAMVFDLQDANGAYEQTLSSLRDTLGGAAVDFFNPTVGPADSALDGSVAALRAPPRPSTIDLRAGLEAPDQPILRGEEIDPTPTGSNAFAVPGSRTASGHALVAGDPHLTLQIPNTWYRAHLAYPDANGADGFESGATLPGVPGVVIGSNGHLAWTFTNATVDTGDLVAIDLNQRAPEYLYHRGTDSLEFDVHEDVIEVKDGEPVTVETTWTIWGPITAQSRKGKPYAYRWTFHDPAAANFGLLDLAQARSVEAGLTLAPKLGMPNQNLIMADRTGEAAWTLVGKLPRRIGFDGRYPVSWTFGDRRWEGYLTADEIPVQHAAPDGAVWSGNQRKLGGEAYRLTGDSGLDGAERAGQIERTLAALTETVTPGDFFALQLDDRAQWMDRWHELALSTLENADGDRAEFRRIIAEWDGHAKADSHGYRLMREWRDELVRLTLLPIFDKTARRDPEFRFTRLRYDEALWALHRDEPIHLLNPAYQSWDELRLQAVSNAIETITEDGTRLAEATWGARNTLRMQHPFGRILPDMIGGWLNMVTEGLPGDSRMPRVQLPDHGASLRMVVAPGDESTGILHLPGGQSGHPLSPYYRAGHREWAHGQPLPFLPGEPRHTIKLTP